MERKNLDYQGFELGSESGADDIEFAELISYIEGTLSAPRRKNLELLLTKKGNCFYRDALIGLEKRFKKNKYNIEATIDELEKQADKIDIIKIIEKNEALSVQELEKELRKLKKRLGLIHDNHDDNNYYPNNRSNRRY